MGHAVDDASVNGWKSPASSAAADLPGSGAKRRRATGLASNAARAARGARDFASRYDMAANRARHAGEARERTARANARA